MARPAAFLTGVAGTLCFILIPEPHRAIRQRPATGGAAGFMSAWRSLLGTGTVIAGGSDFPVERPNPFHGIHAAVTRRPRGGPDPGWQPEQRMTRAEAVRAFTAWNAYAAHQEAELGTLEPGKWADLVACSADVFTCPEAEIPRIEPVLTLVAGEIVLDRRPTI